MKQCINMLITSVGRRTRLLEYFKNELKDIGNLIATDCSRLAPAIYIADKHYIVPRIDDPNYINVIIDICKEEKVNAVLSLIDPELSLIARKADLFREVGVIPICSSYEVCELCLDKYGMYTFCNENNYKCAKTYRTIEDFESALYRKEIEYPVFVKPRFGSASIGISKIYSIEELRIINSRYDDLLIQEFLSGQEYGVDVYTDLISWEVTSIFIKEKIAMRAGETDKALSIKSSKLFELIEDFVKRLGIIGPIDIDVFEKNGDYYISEVNPRFGGGYPLAYECGVNSPSYIINNLLGNENKKNIGSYKENLYMLKHDTIMLISRE